MSKIKVGNKVLILPTEHNSWLWIPTMDKYVGLIGTVEYMNKEETACRLCTGKTALSGAPYWGVFSFPLTSLEVQDE